MDVHATDVGWETSVKGNPKPNTSMDGDLGRVMMKGHQRKGYSADVRSETDVCAMASYLH